MAIILYINNEHCLSLEQLKGYFPQASSNNDIYCDLLDYGRSGDISKWLGEIGENDMADKFEAINSSLSDSQYFSEMASALLEENFPSDIIQKPTPSLVFTLKEAKTEIFDNEAKVQLCIKVLLSVNENYEVKVKTDWGTRAIKFNPNNLYEGKNVTETFTFRKRPGKGLGKIEVCIDDKQVFEENIQQTGANSQTSEINDSTHDNVDLHDLLEKSKAPQPIFDFLSWVERLKKIEEQKIKTITPRHNSASSAKQEPAYIRTAGGVIAKEEWLKRREQEHQKIEQECQRRTEEAESEDMIEKWRRKHGV